MGSYRVRTAVCTSEKQTLRHRNKKLKELYGCLLLFFPSYSFYNTPWVDVKPVTAKISVLASSPEMCAPKPLKESWESKKGRVNPSRIWRPCRDRAGGLGFLPTAPEHPSTKHTEDPLCGAGRWESLWNSWTRSFWCELHHYQHNLLSTAQPPNSPPCKVSLENWWKMSAPGLGTRCNK